MQIQDTAFKSIYKGLTQYTHPTRQGNGIYTVLFKCIYHKRIILTAVFVPLGWYYLNRYSKIAGAGYNACFRPVGEHNGHNGIYQSFTNSFNNCWALDPLDDASIQVLSYDKGSKK